MKRLLHRFVNRLKRKLVRWVPNSTEKLPLGSSLAHNDILRLSHLFEYKEAEAMGPLQQSEALFLFALVKVIAPRVILEFGFHSGHSARNFLEAGGSQCIVHSYDIDQSVVKTARALEQHYANFRFHLKSQSEFSEQDLDCKRVDFIFFDAAHDLILNQVTWKKVVSCLSESAIIAIHDTGTWNRAHFLPVHHAFESTFKGLWLNPTSFVHQPEERAFVDWLQQEYSEYSVIHFHTENVLRHGLTLLQKRRIFADVHP